MAQSPRRASGSVTGHVGSPPTRPDSSVPGAGPTKREPSLNCDDAAGRGYFGFVFVSYSWPTQLADWAALCFEYFAPII